MSDVASRFFCGTELAARIERAECRLLAEGAAAARRRDPALEVVTLPVAGGLAAWGGTGSPLNKLAGLGFAGVPAAAELDAVERAFAARGEAVRVELATLGDPECGTLLTRRGYALAGFENVLGLPLPAPAAHPAAPGLEVAASGEAEMDLWLDVVVTGFAHPDTQGVPSDEEFPREVLERVIGDLASGSGFKRYLARRAGEPAGGASLRLDEGVAQLAGAATLPAHRRRGVQSALLAARLADAAAAGCDVAVVTTQPGSKSQQNVQRQGFELLYTRAVLIRS
ncbi:MAG: GCN5-related N-acetyltransferase [Acidobacteria bacterium]|nr:GCN5-related N-acetyltransferase [Acidobacteriota bacterium]